MRKWNYAVATVLLEVLTLCVWTSYCTITEADRVICLNTHNDLRATAKPTAANMRKLTWNTVLATKAQEWADKCLHRHTGDGDDPVYGGWGENIYWFSWHTFTMSTAVIYWHSENASYAYKTGECSSVCGHYTAIVWANTHEIGCGLKKCPTNSKGEKKETFYFICEYSPAGNYPGVKPYISGAPCSKCPTGTTCDGKLCALSGSGGGGTGGGGTGGGGTGGGGTGGGGTGGGGTGGGGLMSTTPKNAGVGIEVKHLWSRLLFFFGVLGGFRFY